MRRAFAISLAILVVMFATRGVMAQDSQQDGNDLLLKILKERNILSEDEYSEIKGQLAAEKSGVDQKLTALDRSISDYLAKAGDVSGGSTSYVQNRGTTFTSGDGMFSVFFGGLFQFEYQYDDGDSVATNGGFAVDENRFDFGGWFFDPAFMFYTQIATNRLVADEFYPGGVEQWYWGDGWFDAFTVLDAYVDWEFSEDVHARAGRFKVPFGRQSITDESDRGFADIHTVPSYFRQGWWGRDDGFMIHGLAPLDGSDDGMAIEWAAGIWNGMGGNRVPGVTETWLAYGGRAVFYLNGAMPYVDGDWMNDGKFRAGLGAAVLIDEFHGSGDDNPQNTAWEVDFVASWSGFYLLAEYFSNTFDPGGSSSETDTTGWYVQASYMVLPAQLEILARYGMVDFDGDFDWTDMAVGGAWYVNGHEFKLYAFIGQFTSENGHSYDDIYFQGGVQIDW